MSKKSLRKVFFHTLRGYYSALLYGENDEVKEIASDMLFYITQVAYVFDLISKTTRTNLYRLFMEVRAIWIVIEPSFEISQLTTNTM